MPRTLNIDRWSVFLGLVTLCGCQHSPVVSEWQGGSSFHVVQPAPAAGATNAAVQDEATAIVVESVPAYLDPTAVVRPEYPAGALAAHAGARSVAVTVWFDPEGKAVEVARSLNAFPITDEFSSEFFSAVEAAVMRWRISPPRNIFYQRESSGERTYLRNEPLPTSIELVFRFEASGHVKS